MSDSTSAPLPAAPDAVALLDPAEVLAAAADPTRYAILRELADGATLSVNDLAAKLKRPVDSTAKHLRILREARLIRAVTSPDGDGRKTFHDLPALFRSRDAAGKTILDFGAVVLRFG